MSQNFDEEALATRLAKLNNSQQSIETVSHWCCFHRKRSKQVVATWESEYTKAPREKRLAFIYLANDVLQNSRKKGPEFVNDFFKVLPRAFKHLAKHADEKTLGSLGRLVSIWEERKVFGQSLPPNLRESLTPGGGPPTPTSSKSPAKAARDLSGPVATLATAYAALETVQSAETRAESACAVALSTELLDDSAAAHARRAGTVPALLEDIGKASKTLEEYQAQLEASLVRRDEVMGSLRTEVRNQEEAFKATEEKLGQAKAQLDQLQRLKELANAAAEPTPELAHGDPRRRAAGAATQPVVIDAAPDSEEVAAEEVNVADVAAALAEHQCPAAALRDALTGLSKEQLNQFGSQLAMLAASGVTETPSTEPEVGLEVPESPAKRAKLDASQMPQQGGWDDMEEMPDEDISMAVAGAPPSAAGVQTAIPTHLPPGFGGM
ncbi:hypothetical protein CYMTET_45847 [Cymbomonas tetramitiformis]|uniref:CID domain-containing protein n=1 Tax=Cymbomonas tetramitiformis TaxID=36881 RepID=A0AAE0EZ99_9CHLO|nr:hypothetical protein CYMTET_45847 [Cymbomonas tetramitiformis]